MLNAPRQRCQQHGITLLESLVALLITAVALLGMVGVQLRTLADTQTSVRRAQAIRLVEDLSERLQSNPRALSVLAEYSADWDSTPTLPTCTNGCNAEQQARRDLTQWRQTVQETLPLGDASTFLVAGESGSASHRQLGVMLSWRENESAAADNAYRTPMRTQGLNADAEDINCPSNRICHFQFIHPNARCADDLRSGPSQTQLICPASP